MSVLKRFREIEKLAASIGIDRPKVVHTGRGHPRLTGYVKGRKICRLISCTPSDHRQFRQLKHDFRQMIREAA